MTSVLFCFLSQTNVKSTTDKEFIHTLTTALIQFSIDSGGKYNSDVMEERCITILLAFIQNPDSASKDLQPYHSEIEVLTAVHRLLVELQHPGGEWIFVGWSNTRFCETKFGFTLDLYYVHREKLFKKSFNILIFRHPLRSVVTCQTKTCFFLLFSCFWHAMS
jgi:hypothetical protein